VALAVCFLFHFVVASSDCGNNCLSTNCPQCLCGNKTNIQDYPIYFCKQYAWDQRCCGCILEYLSGSNANAEYYSNSTNSYNIGLFAIPQEYWPYCSNGQPPCDPQVNTECAQAMWKAGRDTWFYFNFNLACSQCSCCHHSFETLMDLN